jgi:hypothetical protein
MFRKTILAVATTAIIAATSLTPASAHGWHHGFGFGGFGLGLLGAAAIASSTYAPPPSCYQYQTYVTPHGHLRTVLVNVCAD